MNYLNILEILNPTDSLLTVRDAPVFMVCVKMAEDITNIKDLHPAIRNCSCIFIVLEKG